MVLIKWVVSAGGVGEFSMTCEVPKALERETLSHYFTQINTERRIVTRTLKREPDHLNIPIAWS